MKLRGIVLALLLLGALPAAANIRQAPEPELRELMQRTVAEADSFQDRFDAEVWLVDMSGRLKRYVPDAEERLSLLRLVHREASKAGLKPELVLALIHAESRFDRFAISSVGAQGMMQVMPFWKAELGRPRTTSPTMQPTCAMAARSSATTCRRKRATSIGRWRATTAASAKIVTRPR